MLAYPNVKVSALVDSTPLYTDLAGTTLLEKDHPKCPDGRHLRFRQGRWTIMSAAGKPAPDIAFQWIKLVCNGPSIVKHDDKWGFVSVDGELLAGRYFDRAHAFHSGIATIEENGLWAVIGEDGAVLLGPLKLAIPILRWGDGRYSVEFEEGERTLDKALVAELARNPDVLTRPLSPRLPWSEGLAALLDDKTGKWGFIDSAQNFVITPQFDAVGRFNKGVAWAAFPERREWCRIDKAGRVVEWGRGCHCLQPLVEDHDLKALFQPDKVACYDYGIRIVRGIHETTR